MSPDDFNSILLAIIHPDLSDPSYVTRGEFFDIGLARSSRNFRWARFPPRDLSACHFFTAIPPIYNDEWGGLRLFQVERIVEIFLWPEWLKGDSGDLKRLVGINRVWLVYKIKLILTHSLLSIWIIFNRLKVVVSMKISSSVHLNEVRF